MPFSRGAIFGEQLGNGLSQGLLDQIRFGTVLNKANRLSQLPNPQQSLALALLGGGGGSQGNPLDALLARMLSEQLGYGGETTPLPALPNPEVKLTPQQVNENPNSGTASLIRQNESNEILNLRKSLRPGEILVRDKKTGEPGAILPNEFDPNIFEKI